MDILSGGNLRATDRMSIVRVMQLYDGDKFSPVQLEAYTTWCAWKTWRFDRLEACLLPSIMLNLAWHHSLSLPCEAAASLTRSFASQGFRRLCG